MLEHHSTNSLSGKTIFLTHIFILSTKVVFTPETRWDKTVMLHQYKNQREVQKPLLTGLGSTKKFRSHCSRDWEVPGSSEAIARQIARRNLAAASANFFM